MFCVLDENVFFLLAINKLFSLKSNVRGCGLPVPLSCRANAKPVTASRCLFQPVRSSHWSLHRQPSARAVSIKNEYEEAFFFSINKRKSHGFYWLIFPPR